MFPGLLSQTIYMFIVEKEYLRYHKKTTFSIVHILNYINENIKVSFVPSDFTLCQEYLLLNMVCVYLFIFFLYYYITCSSINAVVLFSCICNPHNSLFFLFLNQHWLYSILSHSCVTISFTVFFTYNNFHNISFFLLS